MRPTDEERHRRLCEAILEALSFNGSYLTLPQLLVATGQGWREPVEVKAALDELLARGLIVTKWRRKGVGKHGRPRPVYAALTVPLVLADDPRDPVGMDAIALDPAARQALADYAHERLLAARADVEIGLDEELRWLRTSLALSGELDAADDPAATEEAS